MFRKTLIIIIFATICCSFISCYSWDSTDDTIQLRKYHNYIELELTNITYSGGIAFNLHAQRFEKLESYVSPSFIYFKTLSHLVKGPDIILDYSKILFFKDLDFSQSKNMGYIKIDSNTIQINLKRPIYKENDEISHYVNYEFNGIYKFKIVTDLIPSEEQSDYYLFRMSLKDYKKKILKK